MIKYVRANVTLKASLLIAVGIIGFGAGLFAFGTEEAMGFWSSLSVGLGTAFFVTGLIDITLSNAQRDAFRVEVERVLLERDFVKRLNNDDINDFLEKIVSLQTRRRQDALNLDSSLYKCFVPVFQKWLSGPYRDSFECTIQFEQLNGDNFIAKERLRYVCRVSAVEDEYPNGHVQDTIEYRLNGITGRYANLLRCKIIASAVGFAPRTLRDSNDATIPNSNIIKADGRGKEIEPIVLRQVPELYTRDFLTIELEADYTIEIGRTLARSLSHPTDNASFTIIPPEGFGVECSRFAERTRKEPLGVGGLRVVADDWLFPGEGFVYRIVPISSLGRDTDDTHTDL